MDLLEFADQRVSTPSIRDVRDIARDAWDAAHQVLQSESITDPTIAAVLSQIVLLTPEFNDALASRGLDPRDWSQREIILLRRSTWGEYVLLVADGDLNDQHKTEEALVFSERSLDVAIRAWKRRLQAFPPPPDPRPGVFAASLLQTTAYSQISLSDLRRVGVMVIAFVRRPPMVQTSAPIPPWELTATGVGGRATAGCIVRHANGREGVTSVRHFFPAGSPLGTAVAVEGQAGTVAGEDVMTDSVFIEMPTLPAYGHLRGVAGWLSGAAPSQGAVTVFEGATTQGTTTAIQGVDPGVAQYSPIRQPRVYTPAVTNPGDSGAALIEDARDMLVGFAHERTGASALIQWSSWIWADAVFTALNVRPR